MLPGFGSIQGMVAMVRVVSVCPKPSISLIPVSFLKVSNTAGFNASPAMVQYFSEDKSNFVRSS